MSSAIQAVVFLPQSNTKWTTYLARQWLKKNNFEPIKRVDIVRVDDVITQLRYRIRDPSLFDRYITKKTKNGINFVIGIYSNKNVELKKVVNY